jgi:hypothetical protein
MAQQYKIELEVDAKGTEATLNDVSDILKDVKSNSETATSTIEKGLDGVEKQAKKSTKVLKGIQNIFKGALGATVVIKAFDLLRETFSSNQKVVDTFTTATEALSIAFNDLFKFLDQNVGTVIDYFKGLFENPVQSLKNFGQAIVDNVIERVSSALDALGFLGEAVVKVFAGDFAGAAESAKEAGKELFDVVTGVNNTFDKVSEVVPSVVNSIKDYAKSTYDAAKGTVELNKQAEVAAVINQGLIEKYDRQAEQQRQIRDDETLSIEERIAANERLSEVLEEQQKLMLENVDITIAAAQAEYDKNQNQENYIALLEAQNEREAVLAQIEGFRSEQKINAISLERELQERDQDLRDAKIFQAEEDLKKAEEDAEKRKELINDTLDATINAAGEETKVGKALFIAKQGIRLREQIEQAKATLSEISLRASAAGVDIAKGAASTAKVGFPANIPLLIAFAGQAAGIISSVKSAVNATKAASAATGGGASISTPQIQAPTVEAQAPDFNVVGVGGTNQLADAISGQQAKPQRAYVVSNDVTTAQGLDRNIVESASI